MNKNISVAAAFLGAIALSALSCSPKVYLIDRHTVMEDEAAGEWPDFESEILGRSIEKSPTAFQKVEPNEAKKRLYNVLNGELVSQGKRK